jgi:hypothetical protein
MSIEDYKIALEAKLTEIVDFQLLEMNYTPYSFGSWLLAYQIQGKNYRLLAAGVWYSSLVLIPSILMGLLMIGAQYFHFKISNPFIKHLPSLILLVLSSFIVCSSI